MPFKTLPVAQKTPPQPASRLGLLAGTRVMTLDGALPVEFLTVSDRIVTRLGARRLLQIDVSLVQNARVICIAQDTLGVDRPTEDLVVAPDQPIFIYDWRAKALYGTATALAPAARLVDGEYIRAETRPQARFFTLRFADDVVIYADGVELACDARPIPA